uniref:Aquaporin n=2 Tax=Ditylum brightwellii TaxID=49249 RepID=A0A7S4SC91_9STRA
MVQSKKDLFGAVFAEFLATALFIWIGCGAAISSNTWHSGNSNPELGSVVGISIAFGFGISVLAYGIGHVSGGHINPAVTFSFLIRGEMSLASAIMYMLAQFFGAFIGALFLYASVVGLTTGCEGNSVDTIDDGANERLCASSCTLDADSGLFMDCGPPFGLGTNVVSGAIGQGSAFIAELIGTFVLVFTVLMAAVHPSNGSGPNAAPIAIGWSVMLAHLVLVPLTGCGINPARTFGPAIVSLFFGADSFVRGAWVYYTAPFAGSLCATLSYEIIFKHVPAVGEEAVANQPPRSSSVVGNIPEGLTSKFVDEA